MTVPLPRHPNLDYIKKQAKQLLAAHKNGQRQACQFWRRLERFSNSSDDEILAADLSLADAQFVVALFYGFDSWGKLKEEIDSYPDSDEISLDAVRKRCKHEIPEYAGAGVPLGVVCALNHEGVDIDFVDFAAMSGWAFSFGYQYGDISAAHMGVRGNPKDDGPIEVFAFLPLNLGFDYEMARTAEHDELWAFVQKHVEAGKPIMSEHFDGGLITAYRKKGGRRQVFFDGTVFPGWTYIEKLNPYAAYTLKKVGDPLPEKQIRNRALKRALAKGEPHEWKGTPQGLAALRSYAADVADPSKDFSDIEEWFCWAAFERLMARRCCELWLRDCAGEFHGELSSLLKKAAGKYREAFAQYEGYRAAVQDGFDPRTPLRERARTPERIAVIASILERGIQAESDGVELLEEAAALLG